MIRKRLSQAFLVLVLLGATHLNAQTKAPKSSPQKRAVPDSTTLLIPSQFTGSDYHQLFNTQKKKLSVGAVGEVYNQELLKTTSASFSGLITGRLAGLYSTQTTGEPGNDDVLVFLRGQSPLVMVDGTPQSFMSINPEQIESITLLKDAVSTAMLGMRASNGVLLITTKKGREAKQSVDFTAIYGYQEATRMPKFLNAYNYATLFNEALANEGKPAAYSAADLDAYKNGTDPYGHPDVDWQSQVLRRQTPFSRYNLSVSGNGKTARYYVTLDYLKQNGIFKKEDFNVYNTNADYQRYIFRSNVEMDLNKYVTTALNLFGRVQNTNQPGATNGTIFSNLYNTPNNAYAVKNADSSLGGNLDYQNNLYAQTVLTGYMPIYERDFKVDVTIKGDLSKLAKGLWTKALVAVNAYQRETINRSKTFAVYKPVKDALGNVTYGQYGNKGDQQNSTSINAQNRLVYSEFSMGYDKAKGNHSVNALAMVSNDYRMINSNLPMNFTTISGKVAYNYKETYMAEIAMAYNGVELYPENHRYGFFPAIGLGWNISNESFLKNTSNWLDNLKLRASFGKTGNANAGYYEYNQYYTNGSGYGFGNTVPSSTTTLQLGTVANPNITWEKANKFSAGVDASLLHQRLMLSVDYFNDKYYDLLQVRGDASSIFGATNARTNIGSNRYSGLELQAAWKANAGAFHYFISANVTMLKTKVLYQAEPYRPYSWLNRIGQPVGQLFGYVSEGLFQSQADINTHAYQGSSILPGDIKYKDLNGDGIIDANDQAAIGSTKPSVFYGFNTGFNYKGFDVSILLQGVANRSIQLTGNSYWAFQNNGKGQAYEAQLNRWTPANAGNASYPRLWIGNNANNTLTSSYWVRSGSYLRVKSVEVGYALPAALIKKAGLTQARFFVNATNLFTITSLDNIDPENYTGAYPVMKTINAGVTIKL